jgi:RimJ/RimL family protein N-acetyltransferase
LLETERLLLRKPQLEDAEAFAPLYSDPVVMRFIGGATIPTDDLPSVVRSWLLRWDANGFGHFVVVAKGSGTVLGRTGLNVWDTRTWSISTFAEADGHGQPELGWAFTRAHWGNGYATEAARAVRAWASDIARLVSVINPENLGSQRVAEKLGATPGKTVQLFDGSAGVVWMYPE